MTPVRLEPTAPQSQVKHSTTEPLRSLLRFLWTLSDKMKRQTKADKQIVSLHNTPAPRYCDG